MFSKEIGKSVMGDFSLSVHVREIPVFINMPTDGGKLVLKGRKSSTKS